MLFLSRLLFSRKELAECRGMDDARLQFSPLPEGNA